MSMRNYPVVADYALFLDDELRKRIAIGAKLWTPTDAEDDEDENPWWDGFDDFVYDNRDMISRVMSFEGTVSSVSEFITHPGAAIDLDLNDDDIYYLYHKKGNSIFDDSGYSDRDELVAEYRETLSTLGVQDISDDEIRARIVNINGVVFG